MSRYEKIAAALRERIVAGEYQPGFRLPPQRDLAREWKTTLPTVRQALDQLQRDGFLQVEHGVGTFVADLDRAYDPFAVPSFNEVLRERGLAVETRLLGVEPSVHDRTASTALGLAEQSNLVAIARLRLVGGVPIVYQRSYLVGRHSGQLASYDGTVPLYAFLREQTGLRAASYREAITAAPTTAEVARSLGVTTGSPILVSRRTTATAHGEPFLYDEAYLPPERVQVTVTREGTRYALGLTPILDTREAGP